MSRIRLNQEYRNKVANRMRVHIEQEDTQEKEKFFQERENFKGVQDKVGNLPNYVLKDNILKRTLLWHIIFKTNIQT